MPSFRVSAEPGTTRAGTTVDAVRNVTAHAPSRGASETWNVSVAPGASPISPGKVYDVPF